MGSEPLSIIHSVVVVIIRKNERKKLITFNNEWDKIVMEKLGWKNDLPFIIIHFYNNTFDCVKRIFILKIGKSYCNFQFIIIIIRHDLSINCLIFKFQYIKYDLKLFEIWIFQIIQSIRNERKFVCQIVWLNSIELNWTELFCWS